MKKTCLVMATDSGFSFEALLSVDVVQMLLLKLFDASGWVGQPFVGQVG